MAKIRSAPVGETSIASVEPAASVRLPLTASVPIELPGATVEPDWAVKAPTVPVPLSEAPVWTVTAESASEPVTLRRPAVTVVPPA